MIERRKKRKVRITITKRLLIFFVIYIILFAIYFSTIKFSGITFSRYYSEGNNNSLIGIAKWDVSADKINSNDTLNILAGDSTPQTYTLKVQSESDVSTKYSIVLTNVPNGVEVSIDGGNYQTAQNNTVTFTDVGTFGANQVNAENDHTIRFKALLNSTNSGISQINVNVNFSQVI